MKLLFLFSLILILLGCGNKETAQEGNTCNNDLLGHLVVYNSNEIYFINSESYDDNVHNIIDRDELVTHYSAFLIKPTSEIATSDLKEKISSNVTHQVKIKYSYISETYPPQILVCSFK